jgi:transposase
MSVMTGIDPHKATHTAVAIDPSEGELGRVQVRASRLQVEQLLSRAEPFRGRTWAVESAGGWGSWWHSSS